MITHSDIPGQQKPVTTYDPITKRPLPKDLPDFLTPSRRKMRPATTPLQAKGITSQDEWKNAANIFCKSELIGKAVPYDLKANPTGVGMGRCSSSVAFGRGRFGARYAREGISNANAIQEGGTPDLDIAQNSIYSNLYRHGTAYKGKFNPSPRTSAFDILTAHKHKIGLALSLGPDPYGLNNSKSKSDPSLLVKFKSEFRSPAAEQAARMKSLGKVDKSASELDPYHINSSNTAFPPQCTIDTMIIRDSSREPRNRIATERLNRMRYGVKGCTDFIVPFQNGPPSTYKIT
jgi:hypothetical protein